ncbi:uncharacterized protein LOC117792022 [Drosophila innubila]|uniref:uncharacterized protein LOC117792022 n=1 Tax=Drosophila innubila TaxID=198719 RepID=UPI00148D45D9|nr:uncharacterized protein LOC117792022 [Drosophila innubila]
MSRKSVLTDEQSKLNSRLEPHLIFICPECGKAFRTQAEWRQHLNTKHDYLKKTYSDFNFIQIDENFHECQLCFKWVENAHKTIALLQYHYFMHLDHCETYKCVHCQLSFTRRRAINDHLMSTHIKQIEKYESKVKIVKRQPGKRNDLLQKALMDIDLKLEDQDEASSAALTTSKTNPKPNANASEQALDRCLNAYEDFVRKEEEADQTPEVKDEEELDALCKELFEERPEVTEKVTKQKEVVTIEIDAVGEEEMDKLKNGMKSDQDTETDVTPPSKRKRKYVTPNQDVDIELSIEGLSKLVSYLCPKCGKEIVSMEDWRRHVFKKHDFEHFIENSFQIKDGQSLCLQCDEVLNTTKRSELQKHCFKHLPFRSYLKCTLCERTKTNMSKMFHHIRYNHQKELQRKDKTQLLIKPEPKGTTPHAAKKLDSPESYHRNADQDEERMCKFCNKTFKTVWRFERHALLCRAPGALKIPAKTDTTTADALLQHLREGQIRMNKIWKQMQLEVS